MRKFVDAAMKEIAFTLGAVFVSSLIGIGMTLGCVVALGGLGVIG